MSNTHSPFLAQRGLIQNTCGATSIQHAVVMVCVALAGLGGFSAFGRAASDAIGGDAKSGVIATPNAPGGGMAVSREAGSIEAVAKITRELRGMDATVREAWMAVGAPFTDAAAFREVGVKPAKALLFYGPPGGGKTTLARKVAEEAGVKFISSTGSALLGGYIGQGSGHVKKLFEEARKAPDGKAIIFIDEIDGLGSRTAEGNMGQFAASAINELLSFLDGMAADENVRVIGATNNPAALDEALVRAGRFDRKIYIGMPSEEVLGEILAQSLSQLPVSRSVNRTALAERLKGYGPADIKAVVETAGRRALERVLLDEASAAETAQTSVVMRRVATPPEDLVSFLSDDNYLLWNPKTESFHLSEDGSGVSEPVWMSAAMDAMTERVKSLPEEERNALLDPAEALIDEDTGRSAWMWSEGEGQLPQFLWNSLSDEQAQKVAKHFKVNAMEEVRTTDTPDWTKKVQVNQADFDHALSIVRPSAVPEHMASFQRVNLADVGGYDDLKAKLRKGIERPIKNPEAYTRLGLNAVPKSAILFGPPGTGKSLIAKAVATDLGANVFVIKPADIRNGTPGSAARKIAEVFDRARRAKPAVVLLDELDAIAPARGTSSVVDNEIVNALLTEMQGMGGSSGVVLLGTTNRLDAIDPALLRNGRFGLKLEVGLPDEAARESILRVQTRGKKLGRNVDFSFLAKHTDGMSGADIEALVVAAGDWTIDHAPTRKSIPAEAFTKALEQVKQRQQGAAKNPIGFTAPRKQ